MARERTSGMTAIGIMNIVFGAIGTLVCLLMAVGAGAMAAAGSALEAELGPEAEGAGELAATAGAIIAGTSLLGALACVLLFVGGIGVLKLANWGRKLSIASGGLLAAAMILSFTQGGANVIGFAILAYSVTVVALSCSSTWKEACSGEDEWHAPVGEAADDQFRAAA